MADAVEKRAEKASTRHTLRGNPAYGGRFVLAYLLVALVFGGMIGLFAYLASRSKSVPWSAYQPTGQGIQRAQNIANHVSPKYQESGQTIAAIDAQPPIVQTTLLDAIAIAHATTSGVGGGYEQLDRADGVMMYVFCGTGKKCAISGPPTLERGELLRRESLELALYTFKYMHDVQSVVALLPSLGGTNTAVYLKRSALGDLLNKPIYQALPGNGPFEPGNLPNAQVSEKATNSRFFEREFQQLPNGRALLVLTRPPRR